MILETLEAQTEKMSDRINQINPRIEKVSQQIEVTCRSNVESNSLVQIDADHGVGSIS